MNNVEYSSRPRFTTHDRRRLEVVLVFVGVLRSLLLTLIFPRLRFVHHRKHRISLSIDPTNKWLIDDHKNLIVRHAKEGIENTNDRTWETKRIS